MPISWGVFCPFSSSISEFLVIVKVLINMELVFMQIRSKDLFSSACWYSFPSPIFWRYSLVSCVYFWGFCEKCNYGYLHLGPPFPPVNLHVWFCASLMRFLLPWLCYGASSIAFPSGLLWLFRSFCFVWIFRLFSVVLWSMVWSVEGDWIVSADILHPFRNSHPNLWSWEVSPSSRVFLKFFFWYFKVFTVYRSSLP